AVAVGATVQLACRAGVRGPGAEPGAGGVRGARGVPAGGGIAADGCEAGPQAVEAHSFPLMGRNTDAVGVCDASGLGVTGVDVAQDPGGRVVGQDPVEFGGGQVGAVGDADLTGVQGTSHPDPAAMVDRD